MDQNDALHSEINDLRQANKVLREEIVALREQMMDDRSMYERKIELLLKMPAE